MNDGPTLGMRSERSLHSQGPGHGVWLAMFRLTLHRKRPEVVRVVYNLKSFRMILTKQTKIFSKAQYQLSGHFLPSP